MTFTALSLKEYLERNIPLAISPSLPLKDLPSQNSLRREFANRGSVTRCVSFERYENRYFLASREEFELVGLPPEATIRKINGYILDFYLDLGSQPIMIHSDYVQAFIKEEWRILTIIEPSTKNSLKISVIHVRSGYTDSDEDK